MISVWMLRMLVATALVAVAALVAEEAGRGFGWPRRWVWVGAFSVVASMPWLGAVLPLPSVVEALLAGLAPQATAATLVDASVPVVVAAGPRSGMPSAWSDRVLVGGWAIASLALALVFGLALLRLRLALRRCSQRVRVDGIDVIRAASLGPATIGAVRPAIVLPRWVDELPAAERALIVSHEREHAAARDPLLLAAAALVVTVAPWCLPLWWMHRRLRDAAEADCDARVVARGADRLAYGCALLRAAGRPRSKALALAIPLLGGVNVTRLERRILKMTERRPKHPLLRAVPLMALAAVTVVVACDAAGDAAGAPDRGPGVSQRDVADAPSAVQVRATVPKAHVPEIEARELVEGSRGTDVADEELVAHEDRIEADSLGVPSVSGDMPPHAETSFSAFAAAARKATEATIRLSESGAAHPVGDEPVFYIDGVRVGDRHAALDRLDPARIERIEVLKGPAAAGAYGPDHAAGVIEIYTKKR